MGNIFKPIYKEINSKFAPETVIHNVGLHIGSPAGLFSRGNASLFAGEVNPGTGMFSFQSQRRSMNRNSMLVRAEGEVTRLGGGSMVKLWLRLSRFGIFLFIFLALAVVGASIGIGTDAAINPEQASSITLPVAIGVGLGYVLAIGLLIRFAIRREYRVLENYVRKQAEGYEAA